MEQIRIPYGLEDHLDAVCQQAPQFKDLFSSWVLNKRSCATALKQVAQNYPHYSVHDELHAKNVISNMEQILGEDRIHKLSPTDTWMLLQLAYLHDFGMLLLYEKVEAEWASEDFQEYLKECRESNNPSIKQAADYLSDLKEHLQDDDFEKNWPVQVRRYVTYLISSYYRGKHAELSNQYILSMIQNWGIDLSHNGLIQPRLIKLLGRLSMVHTRSKEDVLTQDYMSNGYSADYIHPRFLAEMLRLGDLLDVDNSRFEPAAEKVTGSLPEDSDRHRKKHEATVHLLITPEQIEYRADCPDHPAYREARVFLDWLEDELTFSAIHWLDLIPKGFGGSAPRLTKKELLLNGKPDVENTSGLRFMMSQEKAFEIIEGSGIYSDKMVFLRELIQNAEDASKIQLWRDLQKRPGLYLQPHANADDLSHIQPYDLKQKAFDSYKITVDIERESDDRFRIRVIDRGTGMNADTVKQMCNVGASYHQDKARRREIESMPAWLRPTAGFGIGLQSVFLVAPTFTMYSRAEKGGIKVTVESRKREGYVQVEEDDSWEKLGTCVEVTIDSAEEDHIAYYGVDFFDEYFFNEFYDSELGKIRDKSININVVSGCSKTSLFPIVLTNDFVQKREFWKVFKLKNRQKRGPYQITQAKQGGIIVWDTETYTLLRIAACSNWSDIEIAFKGKRIQYSGSGIHRINLPYFNSRGLELSVDFYGLDTKEYLSINRNEFKIDKTGELTSLIDTIIKHIVIFLMEQDNLDEWLVSKDNYHETKPDSYTLLWTLADDYQKELILSNPAKFLRPMTTQIKVLSWSENNTYKESYTNLGNVLSDYQQYYFSGYCSWFIRHPEERIPNILDICNSLHNELEHKDVIIENDYILQIPQIHIETIWCCTKKSDEYIYSVDRITTSRYCRMEKTTRIAFFKALYNGEDSKIDSNLERYAIPAIQKDNVLALRGKDVPTITLIEKNLRTLHIISPILSKDKRVKALRKPELISQVVQGTDFNNLVDYVLEKHADPTPCTRRDIIDAYKEFLSELYDAIHEDNDSEADAKGE